MWHWHIKRELKQRDRIVRPVIYLNIVRGILYMIKTSYFNHRGKDRLLINDFIATGK